MSYRVDLGVQPEPLHVRFGESSFVVRFGWMTGSERAAAAESIGVSFAAVTDMALRKIINLEGVEDASGRPVAIFSEDESGSRRAHAAEIIGRIPFAKQLEIVFCILAAQGLTFPGLRTAAGAYIHTQEALDELERAVEKSFRSAGGPVVGCSSSSLNTGTSPTGSA